jgi:Zn-dependent peptidase ImmA (M78 family)
MPKLPDNIMEAKAAKFRSANGISPSEPINLKSLLLKLKVLTLFRPLSESFSGMCLKDLSGNRFMLINSNNPKGRQHFTIAHELFHLYEEDNPVPHQCNPGMNKNSSESNADLFAATLLMPKLGLWELMPESELKSRQFSISTVLRIEHYYSVSRAALLWRLQNVGIISKKQREGLNLYSVIKSAFDYGYDISLYQSGNEGLVIGDFGEKARLLFETGKISEGHYLELLNKITNHDQTKEN